VASVVEWHWGMSCSNCFGFSLSVSFHWLACHCRGVGFNARPVSVGFVMDKFPVGQVFLQVLFFLPVGDIPPMLCTLIHPSILNGI